MLGVTSAGGANVQASPSIHATALNLTQRPAVGSAVRSSMNWAVGMEASSTSTSTAAKSHDDQDDHPILCIEPGIRPIDHATTAATLVATGHSRRMRGRQLQPGHGHRLAPTEQCSFESTRTEQDRELGHLGEVLSRGQCRSDSKAGGFTGDRAGNPAAEEYVGARRVRRAGLVLQALTGRQRRNAR